MSDNKKHQMDRRRFMEKLGLGASAVFFNPIFNNLYDQAFAAEMPKQRLILFYMNAQANFRSRCEEGLFLPKSSRFNVDRYGTVNMSSVSPIKLLASEWPSYFESWKPFLNYARVIDGLNYHVHVAPGTAKHGMRYAGLNGYSGPDKNHETPAAATIDQIIASGPSGDGKGHRSILVGLNNADFSWQKTFTSETDCCFSTGANASIPYTSRTQALEKKLFGASLSAEADGGAEATKKKRDKILDFLRSDISKMEKKLAQPEKERLQATLETVNNYGVKKTVEEESACEPPPPTTLVQGSPPEEELIGLVDGATLAMKCGLTNVVGIASGVQGGHATDIGFKNDVTEKVKERWFDNFVGAPSTEPFYKSSFYFHGDGVAWDIGNRNVTEFYLGLMIRALENLSGARGVMPENTTAILISDRGMSNDHHHGGDGNANGQRNPIFMLTSNPNLLGGGHYSRYEGAGDYRGAKLPDKKIFSAFYLTFAMAFGVNLSSLGEWNHGPIDDILT
jgi:hypothetical protein